MSKQSPMYQKYGPDNEQISSRIEQDVNQGQFAPAIIVSTLDVYIPTYYFPGTIDGLEVKEEHFKGFKAALTLSMASMWKAIDNDIAADMKILQSGIDEIRNNGASYLARGTRIFLNDKTGKNLFEDVIKYFQEIFLDTDFIEGAKAAQTVYLAYWQKLI